MSTEIKVLLAGFCGFSIGVFLDVIYLSIKKKRDSGKKSDNG